MGEIQQQAGREEDWVILIRSYVNKGRRRKGKSMEERQKKENDLNLSQRTVKAGVPSLEGDVEKGNRE